MNEVGGERTNGGETKGDKRRVWRSAEGRRKRGKGPKGRGSVKEEVEHERAERRKNE